LFGSEEENCCAKCENCYIGMPDGMHSCYMCHREFGNKYLNGTRVIGYKKLEITNYPPCELSCYKRWNENEKDEGLYNPNLYGCRDFDEPKESY